MQGRKWRGAWQLPTPVFSRLEGEAAPHYYSPPPVLESYLRPCDASTKSNCCAKLQFNTAQCTLLHCIPFLSLVVSFITSKLCNIIYKSATAVSNLGWLEVAWRYVPIQTTLTCLINRHAHRFFSRNKFHPTRWFSSKRLKILSYPP